MKVVHHEGNSCFRVQRLLASRQYLVRSITHIKGRPFSLYKKINDVGQEMDEALEEGVIYMRPLIAREEAKARGVDVAVPADPALDAAIAAKAERDRKHAALLAEIQAEQAAASRFLNEQNPLWGSF